MQGRFKLWLAAIVGCYLLGFLVGFGPIRPAPKGFTVQNTFRYTSTTPLSAQGETPEATAGRLQAELKQSVPDLNYVKLLQPTELEVATFATSDEMATSDRQTVLQALQQKDPGLKAEPLPQQARERPIWQLGNVLAVYRPRPQLRLGLDLQGGAHVVLLARPETTMSFASPEDRPMVNLPAPEGAAPAPAPAAANWQTPEEIQQKITATLTQTGTPAASIKVEAVAPNRITVTTGAQTAQIATAQRDALQAYLNNAFPGVEITNDKLDSVIIEANTADMVRNIIERRLYAKGIREATVQTQGKDKLLIELPGVKDPASVIQLLGQTAQLQFALVPEKYEYNSSGEGPGPKQITWRNKYTNEDAEWRQVYAESKVEFTGRDLKSNARVAPGQGFEYVVSFELRNERKEAFRKFTGRSVGRFMAIVLDGSCESAPVIKSEIPGSGIIESGEFAGTQGARKANELALLLNAGSLPVPLQIEENRTVSATLGADSIHRSLLAGIVGVLIVMIFMVVVYRLPGLLADVALTLYLFLLLAILTATNATMTLPGIAAFVMSLGMAVDANILIFERLKEELYAGKTARAAVSAGFDRAWTAILDSNVTTLIGASVLYFLGTASIKSFAVTLFLGIVCHLFTAVTVSRWLVTILAHTTVGQKLATYGVPKPPGVA